MHDRDCSADFWHPRMIHASTGILNAWHKLRIEKQSLTVLGHGPRSSHRCHHSLCFGIRCLKGSEFGIGYTTAILHGDADSVFEPQLLPCMLGQKVLSAFLHTVDSIRIDVAANIMPSASMLVPVT